MTKIILALLVSIHGIESSYSKDRRMGTAGPLQVTSVCLRDTNRICRESGSSVRFTPTDRMSLAKSEEIALVYLSYWGPRCAMRYGKPMDSELLARLWHRGPSKKMYDAKGDAYWAKVRKEIESRKASVMQ